ncbi:helix-turn-helix domain-containing protein [Streptomyces luteogriseus]|nr:helix-turn-helix domain-containing protein [Streptomyces luteogriseus]
MGTRVLIARNAAGRTQVELADLLDRPVSWVANVEAGRVARPVLGDHGDR